MRGSLGWRNCGERGGIAVAEIDFKVGFRETVAFRRRMDVVNDNFHSRSGVMTDCVQAREQEMISVQRVERLKIGGCVDGGAFTVVKDTTEDFTVLGVMFQSLTEVSG